MARTQEVRLTFSKHFGLNKKILDRKDLFDISLVSDLPLFIDPFHLFYSRKVEYKKLHEEIIKYLVFLKGQSLTTYYKTEPPRGVIEAYYKFPEIRQNWLGYSFIGNKGHGLGKKFAIALNESFSKLFKTADRGNNLPHLEKLTLISIGVGKDTISDFTTNLIHAYLAKRTEEFAIKNIDKKRLRKFWVQKAGFDYSKKVWIKKAFILPVYNNDYVLLTPKDLLTKNNTWINRGDFIDRFDEIPYATPDAALREQLSSYLAERIKEHATEKVDKRTKKKYLSVTKTTRTKAALDTIEKFPETVDIYIGLQEKNGAEATMRSEQLVSDTEAFLQKQFSQFANTIGGNLKRPTSYEEGLERALYFKKCIEKRGCYKNLYIGDTPVDEDWIQRMFWFTWVGMESDICREPDTGSGEPDFVASQGIHDKTIIEFKLAKSKTLEKNLLKQLEKYKEVEETRQGIWVVIYFNATEEVIVKEILRRHGLENNKNYILVDARKDNKVSASKLK